METENFFWLVGILEGEGCFGVQRQHGYSYPKIQFASCDEDVTERVRELIGGKGITVVEYENIKHNTLYRCSVTGSKATALMHTLMRHMSIRRARKIADILEECT